MLGAVLAGLAGSASAQGLVHFDNGYPSNLSPTATSGGAFFDGFTTPGAPVLLRDATSDFHASLWGGASPSTLTLLVADTLMGYYGSGRYLTDSGNVYPVLGVPAGTLGFFQLEIWKGDAPTLAAALAAGEPGATSTVFENYAGDPASGNAAAYLAGMPAVIMLIPEPSVFALIGLGALAWGRSVRRQGRTPHQRPRGSQARVLRTLRGARRLPVGGP